VSVVIKLVHKHAREHNEENKTKKQVENNNEHLRALLISINNGLHAFGALDPSSN